MKSLESFNNAMRLGGYVSDAKDVAAVPLECGMRSWFAFYVRGLLPTVIRAAKAARGGVFSRETFSGLSLELVDAVEKTGCRIEASAPNPPPTPCVYAANHMSFVETFHLPAVLGAFGPVTVVAKSSLAKYPLFGRAICAVEPILLDRKNPRKDLAATIMQGKERLSRGISVLLFPQGARNSCFDARTFNSLGSKLAREAGVPLVPVACKTDYAAIGKVVKDLGAIDPSKTVKYAIGEAISPKESQSAMQEKAIFFISSMLSRWGVACTDSNKRKGSGNAID